MTIATVHYLSMNVYNAQMAAVSPVNRVASDFTWTSLEAETDYRVDWGLGTLTVTNKALTSNVAILTTSTPHGIRVDDVVTVTGVDATFNGTYTVTDVTYNMLSYAKTAGDVSSTASAGSITAYTPVTTDTDGALEDIGMSYPVAGTYSVKLRHDTTGQIVSSKTVTVGLQGTIAADAAPITHDTSEQVNVTGLTATTDYRVDWGAGAMTVTAKELLSNEGILTFADHPFAVGDFVTVSGVDEDFDGTHELTGVTATTITFALTGADLPEEASAGSVVGYTPATTDGSGAFSKNVDYPAAGNFTISVREDVTNILVAQQAFAVA